MAGWNPFTEGPRLRVRRGRLPGAGAGLLDRTRLPRGPGKPAKVGEGSRVGGNAVVCGGITVGRGAIVAAVEDDVPDSGV